MSRVGTNAFATLSSDTRSRDHTLTPVAKLVFLHQMLTHLSHRESIREDTNTSNSGLQRDECFDFSFLLFSSFLFSFFFFFFFLCLFVKQPV